MKKSLRNQFFVALTTFIFSFFIFQNAFSFSLASMFDNIFKPHPAKRRVIPNNPQNKVTHVKVGVYVLHVGKYDFQSANTPLDFYLIFQCQPICSHLNFEIMNATNANSKLVAKQQGVLIYRVQADLNKTDNLRNYPFDSHTLDIIIEDKELTRDIMDFHADQKTTSLDDNLSVVGYRLLPTWTTQVTDHYYKVFDRTFSSYKFTMFIERPWLAGILKGILPALIVVCCSFLALFMKIEHSSQRLGIATSTLITAAVFHLNLTASLPPLGYVTYADMFMLINYLCLLAVLIDVVLTTYFVDSAYQVKAEQMNIHCAWIVPVAWLILQVFTWLFFNPMKLFHTVI